MAQLAQSMFMPDGTEIEFCGKPMYGVCSTAASTQTKKVNISGFTSGMMIEGARVTVRFTNSQAYNGIPQLQINNLSAKNIWRTHNEIAGYGEWNHGAVIDFTFNGTAWIIEDGNIATTTYYGKTKLSSSTNDSSSTTAATPSAVKAAYDLAYSKAEVDPLVVVLDSSDWSNNTQTVTASGVTNLGNVLVTYDPASRADWLAADIYCSAQATDSLTFTCSTTPTTNITAYVLLIG